MRTQISGAVWDSVLYKSVKKFLCNGFKWNTMKTILALLYYESKYTSYMWQLFYYVQPYIAYRFSWPPIGLPETKLYWILDPITDSTHIISMILSSFAGSSYPPTPSAVGTSFSYTRVSKHTGGNCLVISRLLAISFLYKQPFAPIHFV